MIGKFAAFYIKKRGLKMDSHILSVENLSKHFIINKGFSDKAIIEAVKEVSFELKQGDSLGLIGESGCGKTTVANLILRLIEPSSGEIHLFSDNVTYLNEAKMRRYRKDIQIVFQHSSAVLDPKMTIGELIQEPLAIHDIVGAKEYDIETDRLLKLVGLAVSEKNKYPYQLSGGQNQRVIIARAIATRPRIIVCDEPVASLDVSVQGQILNLLTNLKQEMNLTYLFITHDLKVMKHICNRIAVMYKGSIVEIGDSADILNNPTHSYSKVLMESVL